MNSLRERPDLLEYGRKIFGPSLIAVRGEVETSGSQQLILHLPTAGDIELEFVGGHKVYFGTSEWATIERA